MAEGGGGIPGEEFGPGKINREKIQVHVGVIPPCKKWKDCKIAASQMGSMIVEHRGYMYYIGNMLCFRCTHLMRTDLFEDMTDRITAQHPDAEEVVGVTPGDLFKMQAASGGHKGPGQK